MILHWCQCTWQTHFAPLRKMSFSRVASFCQSTAVLAKQPEQRKLPGLPWACVNIYWTCHTKFIVLVDLNELNFHQSFHKCAQHAQFRHWKNFNLLRITLKGNSSRKTLIFTGKEGVLFFPWHYNSLIYTISSLSGNWIVKRQFLVLLRAYMWVAIITEHPGLCDEMSDYTKTACDLSSRDPVVILGKMLTTNNVTVGEFVCALQQIFNLQNCCPFLKQFFLFRWVWYWWRLIIHHFVYYATQCIARVIHAIAHSLQLGVVRGYVTITHKSLRISWLYGCCQR